LRELEPHVEGIAALHVPSAAIVDFRHVCAVLADEITAAGGEIRLNQLVTGLQETQREIVVFTTGDELRARCVVNCAGLHSDRVAALHGHDPSDVRIVPFRGEYFELLPERRHLVRNLVYPVPDPSFPFLGVHFTRMIDGGVHAGPNAVLALAREGYGWRTVDWADVRDAMTFRGLWRLAGHHWRTGAGEIYRSLSRRAFVRALQRLVPEVRASDLVRAPAGVRAQALDREGNMLDDFVIRESARIVDVVNAPSPAATASLEIGRIIAASVVARLG
jgi:L-2-hydroxyglutarate oxidase